MGIFSLRPSFSPPLHGTPNSALVALSKRVDKCETKVRFCACFDKTHDVSLMLSTLYLGFPLIIYIIIDIFACMIIMIMIRT
jgi:hypothetical protein